MRGRVYVEVEESKLRLEDTPTLPANVEPSTCSKCPQSIAFIETARNRRPMPLDLPGELWSRKEPVIEKPHLSPDYLAEVTRSEKRAIINSDGLVEIVSLWPRIGGEREEDLAFSFRPHWSSCPASKSFRRGRKS